ncbi:MAG: NAD-dependent epimerase/dehydratase family protein [Myxococcota bacterium]
MSATAIVTGGSGWLGRRLVRALRSGLEDVPALADPGDRAVRCLVTGDADRAIVAQNDPRAACVGGDLLDPASLAPLFEGAAGATVFHCAGVIHPRRVREFFALNVEGTRAVLDAARAAGVRRFVHVSSNSPIGCNPDPEHRFDEDAPYHPYMGYGRSKKQAEDLVAAAHGQGLECVVVRPPWFYGPGQPPRQTEFFRMIKDGRMPIVGGGGNRRSMAYTDNIVQGLLLCERVAEAAGRTYWIADRRAYTMNEIVETVADVLEQDFGMTVKRGRLSLPGFVSEVALLADRLLQGAGLYQQKVHVLSEMNKNIACSIDRAQRELGYDPKVELREGMKRSVQALLDEGAEI